ncbi:MAG: hypothetical protein GY715_01910 [Planctomycetes bacterium]|nr:hypothetical protein [Planctomycetota bacterium]
MDQDPNAEVESAAPDAAPASSERPAAPALLKLRRDRFPLMVLLACFAIELLIYMADYWLNYRHIIDRGSIRRLFTTTTEDGIASWASQTQTALVAATLWILLFVLRAKGVSRWQLLGWAVLAAFFSYMSLDDGAKVHERVGSELRRWVEEQGDWRLDEHFPSYSWQFFLLPLFAAMGVFMLGFLWFQLKDWLARALLLTAIGMLVVAIGIDWIEGLDQKHELNLYNNIAEKFDLDKICRERFRKNGYVSVQHFFKSAEECFGEMGANSVLWFLFLRHLMRSVPGVNLVFTSKKKRDEPDD